MDRSLSRQAEGTGIGLALVKTLVTSLGGTITVDSKVGIGSAFTVLLPMKKLRKKNLDSNHIDNQNHRLIQAVTTEFSDIYLD